MGGGKSSSSNATNVTDQRIGATDQAVVVAGGSKVSVQTVDAGAVAAAQSIANNALAKQAETTKAALDGNVKVATSAMATVDSATAKSLNFAGDSLESILDFSRDVGATAYNLVNTANNALKDVSNNSIATVERSVRADSTVVMQDLIKYAALVGAGLIAAKVFRK